MPIFMHLLIRIIIFLMFNFVVGSVVVGFIFLGSIAVVVKSVVFVRIGRGRKKKRKRRRRRRKEGGWGDSNSKVTCGQCPIYSSWLNFHGTLNLWFSLKYSPEATTGHRAIDYSHGTRDFGSKYAPVSQTLLLKGIFFSFFDTYCTNSTMWTVDTCIFMTHVHIARLSWIKLLELKKRFAYTTKPTKALL